MASQAHKTTDLRIVPNRQKALKENPGDPNRSPCFLHAAERYQAGGQRGDGSPPFLLLRSAGQRGPGGASPLLLSLPYTNPRGEVQQGRLPRRRGVWGARAPRQSEAITHSCRATNGQT